MPLSAPILATPTRALHCIHHPGVPGEGHINRASIFKDYSIVPGPTTNIHRQGVGIADMELIRFGSSGQGIDMAESNDKRAERNTQGSS